MQHYGMTISPRVLLAYIVRTILVMLGRLPMNSAFLLTPQGLWQAIGASVVIAFLASVYPLAGGGLGLLVAKIAAQIIAVTAVSLLFMAVLKAMGLGDQEFALLVPFIWFENVQYLVGGLIAYGMLIVGSDQVPVLILGPFLAWTVYWLWRAARDQVGRGGWVATGFILLSVIVESGVTFTLFSRVHLPAG